MAIHKKNNYTSPEVEIVEFKMEKGFVNSPDFTAGKDNPQVEADQGTQTFERQTWYINNM